MKLFGAIGRDDASPAQYGEDSFAFMNRAAGARWENIRSELDAWFAAYPALHAADLRGRFRSNRSGAHWGAWWELYLHRLFTCLGYGIAVHPELPGTTRRPDFELSRAGERLYLEAAVVFSGIRDAERDGVREGWIMNAVNRGHSKNFYVTIDFEQTGTIRPKDVEVYAPIEGWLEGLDPDDVSAEHQLTGELPSLTLAVRDWLLTFEAIPIKAEARGDDHGRLLGGGPAWGGFVDDKDQLRDTTDLEQSAAAVGYGPGLRAVCGRWTRYQSPPPAMSLICGCLWARVVVRDVAQECGG